MVLNGAPYIERAPYLPTAQGPDGVCAQCAFWRDTVGCYHAVMGLAERAFGGDCMARDVVYVHAEDLR